MSATSWKLGFRAKATGGFAAMLVIGFLLILDAIKVRVFPPRRSRKSLP